jgi:hypothetical protein
MTSTPVCGSILLFFLLSLLSIFSPTTPRTFTFRYHHYAHAPPSRPASALAAWSVFDHVVKRHGLGVYEYTRCVAGLVSASKCLSCFLIVLFEPFQYFSAWLFKNPVVLYL